VDYPEYQDLVTRWRDLDRQAVDAENRLKRAGQLAASPEAAAWIQEAVDKRREADTCLLLLLRSLGSLPDTQATDEKNTD
jgi:hypothetical protein